MKYSIRTNKEVDYVKNKVCGGYSGHVMFHCAWWKLTMVTLSKITLKK